MVPQQGIAHYRVTGKLGEGGMGAVYRATDTKLGREVAIKVIPEAFAHDADRMARFTREAQVLASLNHPNIAAIYGVEENAIVMELVEGEELRGPIPLDQALPIIQQLIDALEYAHDKGVVHRDLKPANIKITPEGRVKVLDFGLAKAAEVAQVSACDSRTQTISATHAGMIMGTAAYMAPEQARGQNVDRRADIWAFGVVVWETLAGRRLFGGTSVSDTVAAVLTKEPDLDAVPANVRRLLRLCLVKDSRQRLSAIGDARFPLEETQVGDLRYGRSILPWMVAGLLAIAAVIGWWKATRPADHRLVQFSVDLGPHAVAGSRTTAILSPDGTRVVFPSRGPDGKVRLSTRLLNQPKAVPILGTESAVDPFFSSDGGWIGFFADNKMKKIPVTGGVAVTLCAAPMGRGASWGPDGNIIAALNTSGSLFRVPVAGGTPEPLTKPSEKGERTHRWPQILPRGQTVLFTAHTSGVDFDNAGIAILSLRSGQWKVVQRNGYFGRFLPSGHLVYIERGTIFGVRFDIDRGEVQGTPTPLIEDIAAHPGSGGGRFDFADTGTLVYSSGTLAGESHPIVWLNRNGTTESLLPTPGPYFSPQLSPDGKRLALAVGDTGSRDISVYDLERDTMTKITFTGHNHSPLWTPDGKHIIFVTQGTQDSIWWMRADGASEPVKLLEGQGPLLPHSLSPDSRKLAYAADSPATHVWILPLDISDPDHPKAGQPEPFLRTPAGELDPAFSPDGRWMAYTSNESGTPEVYVRPWSGLGGKWQISSGGGRFPTWSRAGLELLYVTLDGQIMVASYSAKGESFAEGTVRQWSDKQIPTTGYLLPDYDLSPDGRRLVVFSLPADDTKASVHVTFVLNFFDELRRRLPPGGK